MFGVHCKCWRVHARAECCINVLFACGLAYKSVVYLSAPHIPPSQSSLTHCCNICGVCFVLAILYHEFCQCHFRLVACCFARFVYKRHFSTMCRRSSHTVIITDSQHFGDVLQILVVVDFTVMRVYKWHWTYVYARIHQILMCVRLYTYVCICARTRMFLCSDGMLWW